jgi:hypothetical protein
MIELAIRSPLSILLLSYVIGMLVRMIPVRGDQGVALHREAEDWDVDMSGAEQLDV